MRLSQQFEDGLNAMRNGETIDAKCKGVDFLKALAVANADEILKALRVAETFNKSEVSTLREQVKTLTRERDEERNDAARKLVTKNMSFAAVNEAVRELRFRYQGIEDDLMVFASLNDLEKNEADKATLEICNTLSKSPDPNIIAEIAKAKGVGILKPGLR